MATATLERLPNTVSACHAEISKLREIAADANRVVELEKELAEMTLENKTLTKRIEELEESSDPDAIVAIEEFLLEVQRPVGKYKFDVLHGPATDRAILGLYDAAGRQP